jgi:hypothetical protein
MTTGITIALYLCAVLIFAVGNVFLSYGQYATSRGWPAGEWFRSSTLAMPGLFLMLVSVIAMVVNHSLWAILIVPVLGLALAFTLIEVLGPRVQMLSLVMVIGGTITYFICLA